MPKSDYVQNNFTAGEISPNALGRFDINKYQNGAKTIENFLIRQLGGVMFRPGTKFIYETKDSTARARLLKFQYSTTQSYVIEAGDLYFRFFTDDGILLDGASPVEVVTPFTTANLNKIRYAQNADTMYIATGVYPVYKLQRTSATTFTLTAVNFVRGPFLDDNTSVATITPSADTGTVTLTASDAIFDSDHVGSLWKVKDGVVKITGYTSAYVVTGDVQTEPDGTAGNLGLAGDATTEWAEGAWSAYRGYPQTVTFHEGRLWFGATTNQPGGMWGSVSFTYESFEEGAEDDDSINIELNADTVVSIRWLSSAPKGVNAGTTGGVFVITSSGSQPITPSNVNAKRENLFATAEIQGERMFNYVYFVQNDKQRFLESGYFYDIDSTDAIDTTLLADHILDIQIDGDDIFYRGDSQDPGAYDIAAQQSPNNRIWIIRQDGQIAVLTRNVRQEINGWSRIKAGSTISCDGKSGTGQFESVVAIQREGDFDRIWVIANRRINGSTKRFVEYFTSENFKYQWEPVRLDCSLSLNSPITITDIDVTEDPILVTAPSHGLSNGDTVQLDNIVGAHQLNGNRYIAGQVTTNTFRLGEVT